MARFVFSAFADEAGDSLEEQISALVDNGIGYIEPRNIGGKPILSLTVEELKAVREALDKNGIKTGSLGSPIGKFPISEDFSLHLSDFDKALRACDILGTKNMRMFSFFVEQDKLEENRDEVLRRMNTLVSLAHKLDIRLCHENESAIYGQMPEEVADLLTNVKGLYGIFDPANYRMNNADVYEGIKATLINLGYLHIKDAIFETQCITPAGEGEGKIGEIIDIVNEATDELVYLTVEPHLHIFSAYKMIDEHELKGKYQFNSNREAFDFAVRALENLMIKHGYRKDEFGIWQK